MKGYKYIIGMNNLIYARLLASLPSTHPSGSHKICVDTQEYAWTACRHPVFQHILLKWGIFTQKLHIFCIFILFPC